VKKQTVIYQLVLDRSGSMSSIREETINGFNEQIQRIKEMNEFYPNQDIRVNLCLFNHHIHHHLSDATPKDIQELCMLTYRPSGLTALYDAVGDSIRKVKKQIKALDEEANYRVFFVIITDGHENSSKRYSYEKISSLIAKLQMKKKWEFSYLGSTLDAVEIAKSLSIKSENAMYFRKEEIEQSLEHINCKMASLLNDYSEHEAEEKG